MMQNTRCTQCGFAFYSSVPDFKCPQCKLQFGVPRKTPATPYKAGSPYPIVNHWHSLHEYAPSHRNEWDKAAAIEFFNEWKARIPSYSCSCSEDFEAMLPLLPPVFSSPKSFARRAWEWHDKVSADIGKPRIAWRDSLASWWGEVAPARPNLLITVATGKCLQHWEIARPSFEHYARKINADLIAIVNSREPWWGYEKFRIQHFVPQYERTIFADCDLVFSKDCENLLNIVPASAVGLHDDWPKLGKHDWIKRERQDVCDSQDWEPIEVDLCYNSGLVVCSREHEVWQRPSELLPTQHHCAEQFYVEQRILRMGYDVYRLPVRYNTQWWMPDYKRLLPAARVNHLANSLSKVADLRAAMKLAGY